MNCSIMELPEDDKFKSSQSFVDTPNDILKIVEENYQRFNDIINQNAPVDTNLEKELAKEDKKCTFLQYKIENLKQRFFDAKEASTSLQKYVRDQQMEIENVSAVIYEQLQELNSKFPPDGLSQYSDAVSVNSNARDWIQNLKNLLQQDIEDYNKKNFKVSQQYQMVDSHLSRIQNYIAETKELENRLKTVIPPADITDFSSFKRVFMLMEEKFNECTKLKSEEHTQKIELDELKRKEVEAIGECQRSLESFNQYNKIIDLFRKKCDGLKTEQIELENLFHQTMNDTDLMLSRLMEQLKIVEADLDSKKQQNEKLASIKLIVRNENHLILAEVEQLESELLKIEKFILSYHTQEQMSLTMKQTVQQQINVLETTTTNCKFLLRQLMEEIKTLEQTKNTSETCESSLENLLEMINIEQKKIDYQPNKQDMNSIFNLKQVVEKLTEDNARLKNDLNACYIERNFHESFSHDLERETSKLLEKQIAAVDQVLHDTEKDITNLFSATLENQLQIDSLQEDIQTYTEYTSELQPKIWAINQKHENLRNELIRVKETISKENVTYESKKKLLEDLEKNSFPKNKIPINWFKSFEKQKQDYDVLVKQRLELEKQRNKLIIEIDSQTFQEDLSDPNSKSTLADVKNTMFDVFKERVRKRKSTSSKS